MPPSTLEIVTRARDTIRDEPQSYEFIDYCHCLAGHVYQQATGESYDNALNREDGFGPHRPFDTGTPVGDAIEAILVANHGEYHGLLTLGRISFVNSHLTYEVSHPNDDERYRLAAVKALDTTIAHLEETS